MAKFQVSNQGSNGTLAVFFTDGTSKTIQSTHPSYVETITYLVATPEEEHDEAHIKEIANPGIRIAGLLQEIDPLYGFDQFRITHDGLPVTGPLADLINARLTSREGDWERFARFLSSLERNPSFTAKEGLYSWVTRNGLHILEDGRFVAHKGVNVDFTSKHAGPNNFIDGVLLGKAGESVHVPHFVGTVVSKRRGDVDDSRQACSTGLHVGTLAYASDFAERLLTVAVWPEDVVGGDQHVKIRVARYEVLSLNQNKAEFAKGDYTPVDNSGEVTPEEVEHAATHPVRSKDHGFSEEERVEYNALVSAGRRLYDNLRTQFGKTHEAALQAALDKFGTYAEFAAKRDEERAAEAEAARVQEVEAQHVAAFETEKRLAAEAAAAEDARVQAAQQALTEGRSNAEEDVVAATPTEASSELTLAENAALVPELAADLANTSLGHKPLARKWSHLTTESSVRRYRKAQGVSLSLGTKVKDALS